MFLGGTPFSDTGTVEVVSSSLQLNGPVAQITGALLSSGEWIVAGGGSSVLSATINGNAAVVRLAGNAPQFNSLATNAGTFELARGKDFAPSDFANTGTLILGPGSAMTLSGDFTTRNASVLRFALGTVPASNQSGKLSVSGQTHLAGTVAFALADGHGPATGENFGVMTCGSRTRDVAVFDNLYLQRTKILDPIVTESAITVNTLGDVSELAATAVSTHASWTTRTSSASTRANAPRSRHSSGSKSATPMPMARSLRASATARRARAVRVRTISAHGSSPTDRSA